MEISRLIKYILKGVICFVLGLGLSIATVLLIRIYSHSIGIVWGFISAKLFFKWTGCQNE